MIADAKSKNPQLVIGRPAAIRVIESSRLPLDKICTHQLPLAEFQKGLDLVASGRSRSRSPSFHNPTVAWAWRDLNQSMKMEEGRWGKR